MTIEQIRDHWNKMNIHATRKTIEITLYFSVILNGSIRANWKKWRTSLIEMNIRLNNPYSTSGLHVCGMANKIPVLSPRLIWVGTMA